MLQAQPAWQTLPGADHVAAEDESWLKQSDFRFPDDSEEDDMHDVTARAYVQAIASLKVQIARQFSCLNNKLGNDRLAPAQNSALRSRRFASIAQGQAPLLLEVRMLQARHASFCTAQMH